MGQQGIRLDARKRKTTGTGTDIEPLVFQLHRTQANRSGRVGKSYLSEVTFAPERLETFR